MILVFNAGSSSLKFGLSGYGAAFARAVEVLDCRAQHCEPDLDIAHGESAGRILVIETQEELTVAWEVLRVVQGG